MSEGITLALVEKRWKRLWLPPGHIGEHLSALQFGLGVRGRWRLTGPVLDVSSARRHDHATL
jgi:hypothetical protein